jgi:hypothetical protein
MPRRPAAYSYREPAVALVRAGRHPRELAEKIECATRDPV